MISAYTVGRAEERGTANDFTIKTLDEEANYVFYISGCFLSYIVLYFVSLTAVVHPRNFNNTLHVVQYWREYLASCDVRKGNLISDLSFWS